MTEFPMFQSTLQGFPCWLNDRWENWALNQYSIIHVCLYTVSARDAWVTEPGSDLNWAVILTRQWSDCHTSGHISHGYRCQILTWSLFCQREFESGNSIEPRESLKKSSSLSLPVGAVESLGSGLAIKIIVSLSFAQKLDLGSNDHVRHFLDNINRKQIK
jgi:hypothetical protein